MTKEIRLAQGKENKAKANNKKPYPLIHSYLFIDFVSAESAHAAVKKLDGYKMTRTITLSVNKFTDVEKYSDMNEEYVEPEIEPFTPKEHLKSYLMDPLARDQFVMYKGDDVSVFWNRKSDPPEHVYTRAVSYYTYLYNR